MPLLSRQNCTDRTRVDDAVRAVELELSQEEIDAIEAPYRAHELVGPIARPGEKSLAGTDRKLKT